MAKEKITLPDLTPNTPVGTHLDEKQVGNLAKFIKKCKVQEKDLQDTQVAYDKCTSKDGVGIAFWQTPWGVVSIGVTALAVGLAIGASR